MTDSQTIRVAIARVFLMLTGLAAIAWVVVALPVFWSQGVFTVTAKSIRAGQAYKPTVLESIDESIQLGHGPMQRPLLLNAAAMIRLRLAEDAFPSGNSSEIDQRLGSLAATLDEALLNAPEDAFLWLAQFWLISARNGFQPEYLSLLRMSYRLPPHDAWVALKRNRVALAIFPFLPSDLADLVLAEFASFVRWGLANAAADIAAGPGLTLRTVLYEQIKDLRIEQRRVFARAIYDKELDDVPVPGIAPPTPNIPMPIIPPGYELKKK